MEHLMQIVAQSFYHEMCFSVLALHEKRNDRNLARARFIINQHV